MRQRAAILVILGLVATGCSHGVIVAPVTMPIRGMPPLLTWVGEFTRPAGSTYSTLSETMRFGSISGLARDAQTNQWVGVIDDHDATRLAWLSIDFASGRMTVSPTKMTVLTAGPGVDAAVATKADLEAIAALPDGTFLVSEEGHLTSDGVWQPALLHLTRAGVVSDVIPFPEPFQIHRDQSRGVRDNQGFEGLTRTPDGRLIAALEQPLIEDGPTTSFDRGAYGRLVEFTPRRGGFRSGRQWSYPIERTPRVEGYPEICPDGENGVSEVLALTDTLLLSMERACLQNPQTSQVMNAIQIFAIELSSSDLRKTQVLDLSTLAERMLSKELSRLENFEGMAFGPTALNGTQTLLLVSDDNFRATQKTSFLLFGLRQITR